MSFYTEEKERSHHFILALRMGLPIFLLSAVSLFTLFSQLHTTLSSLIILSLILLAMAIYFLFFLINQSSYEHITDSVTHTFTPEYFFKLYARWSKTQTCTFVMITIDNLALINERYGMKNGDLILKEAVVQINDFFALKEIKKLPICKYKGGSFILLLLGEKENYSSILELFCAKYQENSINEIEVTFSAVVLDNKFFKQQEEVITRLYELQYAQKDKKIEDDYDDDVIPSELEYSVLRALECRRYSVATQIICCELASIVEVTFKLIDERGQYLHQSRFIPFLNRMGKIREYEEHLLEIVVKMASQGVVCHIIALSAVTLRNSLFFQYALELLQHYPEAKNKIVLLLDEKEYCPQIKRFREQLAQYRAVGYKIGLDRLGGNHTTLMYFKEFQVDFVRFDPLYSRHIKEEKYQNIIQGLNITAHLCGATTWIGMIEDGESDKIAKLLKINYRQGNYHGKITPINENIKEVLK
ncbi:MAG: EAL domain-containing protein [Campylobacterales bacterium]|nr:EAL domain-containing protein [Campylobacterales bacterium]